MLECYHYVNIFETKGVEYLLVIIFMISLFAFARLLARPAPARDRAHAPADKAAEEASGACVARFRCPYKLQEEENS